MSSSAAFVYVVGFDGQRFHRTDSCWRIRAGQVGKAQYRVRKIGPREFTPRHTPCRSCFPDAPRVRVRTPYCYACESAKPCAHNGGVMVKIPRVWRYGAALLEPGQVTYSRRYVWPHRAARYKQV